MDGVNVRVLRVKFTTLISVSDWQTSESDTHTDNNANNGRYLNSTTMSKSKTVIKYVRIDCALIKTAQKLYELDQVKKNVVALSYFITNLNTI